MTMVIAKRQSTIEVRYTIGIVIAWLAFSCTYTHTYKRSETRYNNKRETTRFIILKAEKHPTTIETTMQNQIRPTLFIPV